MKNALEFRGEINCPALPHWLFPVLPQTSKCEWAGIDAACLGGSKVPSILHGVKESWGSSISLAINTFKWGIKAFLFSRHRRCFYFQPHFLDLLELLLHELGNCIQREGSFKIAIVFIFTTKSDSSQGWARLNKQSHIKKNLPFTWCLRGVMRLLILGIFKVS